MAFIKIHGEDGTEALINTDNVNIIEPLAPYDNGSKVVFNVPVFDDKKDLLCDYVFVTETVDQIFDAIKAAK